ncbi:MAG: hypothetical protein K2J20_02755, partial [Bacilli bacterium]|nr:hypothetical protein [Bacilli bacterium]
DLSATKKISSEEETIITTAFQELEAKLFKFAVIGDYDEYYLETYKNILENSNFILLENQNQLVYYNSNSPINIIGLSNSNNLQDLYQDDYFNITLMHKPDLIQNIPNTNLAFAGHSLGGQYIIPFIGGIKKIEGATTYIDSYYKVDKSDLYISSGVGTQNLSIRLFNKPSINLYRLYNS